MWDLMDTWSVSIEYMSVHLTKYQCWKRLVLFVGIRVGVRILREVKGEDFADDAISLLWVEKGKKWILW